MRLILASASPRRAELLRTAGFDFEVRSPDVDEAPRANELPQAYVRRLAAEKAAAVLNACSNSGALVLGADTAVVIDGGILGKPDDADDGRRMLERLSGRGHDVMTGINLTSAATEVSAIEVTSVFFSPLTTAEIDWYLDSREGMDKAGGYGIQGLAARFVTRIEGSYSNVVGLPLAALYRLLRELQSGYPNLYLPR